MPPVLERTDGHAGASYLSSGGPEPGPNGWRKTVTETSESTWEATGAISVDADNRSSERLDWLRTAQTSGAQRGTRLGMLTPREAEVIEQLAQDRTNKEIATTLGMRPKTVMHHCASIYRKLGVHGRAGAVAVAMRSGR